MMTDPIAPFAERASGFARNPLGIIALFIVLVYSFAALVTIFSSGLTSAERVPLIYFLIVFPVLVLAVFTWLVIKHSGSLFAPSDFKSEDNYVIMQQLYTARKIQDTDLKDFRSEPTSETASDIEKTPALKGWFLAGEAPADYEIGVDASAAYAGGASAYIKSRGVPRAFGTLMQIIKAEIYKGKRLRMSGTARSENVRSWAGFWMRVDTPDRNGVSFDNMQNRPIRGETGWTTYQIVLDVPEDSSHIAFGLLLDGPGQVWLGKFEFEVVSNDVSTTGELSIQDQPVNLNFKG